jgi:hypothetical protein
LRVLLNGGRVVAWMSSPRAGADRGTLPLATLCLAVRSLAPSAALADSPVPAPIQFPACQLGQAAFSPGFIVYATITNTTVGPVTNWSVSFTMASDTSAGITFGRTVIRTATGGTIIPLAYDAQPCTSS